MVTGEGRVDEMIRRDPDLEACKEDIEKACSAAIDCYSNNGKLLICGNGGSCADADHIVGELMKSFEKKRPLPEDFKESRQSASLERGGYIAENLQNALPAISLCSHTFPLTAISNDMDASLVYAQQIVGYGRVGDLLIAISTSGNSQNIIDAAITAKARGLTVIGMTGQNGGSLKQHCDISICVPSDSTPKVQEYHLPVYHTICQIVENSFF